MVKERPRWMMLAAAGAVAAAAAWVLLSRDSPNPSSPVQAGERRKGTEPVESPLPVIGYNRVENPQPVPGLGDRDLFDFEAPPPPPTLAPTPPPVTLATLAPSPTLPTPPPLPPMNIKYIGAVEKKGAKVAMLMTDKSEVLTGQAGEVVGNRFRIVKIGLESVDIQEVGSDQVRRIPLRGN
jgi:hypothetical protein